MNRSTALNLSAARTLGVAGWLFAAACATSQPLPTPAPVVTPPATLAEVAQRCAAVQASLDLPLGCETSSTDSGLAMVVQYGTPAQVDVYESEVAEYLGVPFCEAARGVGRSATVYSMVGGVAAVAYDCDLQTLTPYVRVASY